MANSLSAKKRIRQNVKRRGRNRWRKDQIKTVLREFDQAVHAGDRGRAEEQLRVVCSVLDRVAAKGTIHKNAAARKKARLSRRLQALSA